MILDHVISHIFKYQKREMPSFRRSFRGEQVWKDRKKEETFFLVLFYYCLPKTITIIAIKINKFDQ